MIFWIIARATLPISRGNTDLLVQQILAIVKSRLQDDLVNERACSLSMASSSLVAPWNLHLHLDALHLVLHLVIHSQALQILVESLLQLIIAKMNILLEIFCMLLDNVED